MENNNRPSWDDYFTSIALLTSQRSNCISRKVGCIIVKDNKILSLGYNGTPSGTVNCFEGGCVRCCDKNKTTGGNLDLCMCIHAEENALLFVSKADLFESTLYTTLLPCIGCVKKILQCQIKRVVYINTYNEELSKISLDIFNKYNVIVEKNELIS